MPARAAVWVAVSATAGDIYVTNFDDDTVSVITPTNTILTTITVVGSNGVAVA